MFRAFHRTVPFFSAVALLGGLSIGCAGEAESTPKDPMSKLVDQRVEEVLDELEATDEQRERIHALKDELLAEVKDHRAKRQEVHEQVQELWLQGSPDPEQAHKLVDQRIDEFRATAHKATDAVLELHSILTPEQRKALAERMEKRRKSWHHRWHGE